MVSQAKGQSHQDASKMQQGPVPDPGGGGHRGQLPPPPQKMPPNLIFCFNFSNKFC